MHYTTNYQLNQWEATDRVTRADFNADNAKLDASLASIAAAASGGPQIEIGSYIGTGKYGRDNPCSITLSHIPKLLILFPSAPPSAGLTAAAGTAYYTPAFILWGTTQHLGGNTSSYSMSYNGSSISWYATTNANEQYNISDYTYHYFAIG